MPQVRLEERKEQLFRAWIHQETTAIDDLAKTSILLGRRSLYARVLWHLEHESNAEGAVIRRAHLELLEEAEASALSSNRQYLTGIRDAAAVAQGWILGYDAHQ